MKLRHLRDTLPLIAIALVIWQWSHIKNFVTAQTQAPATSLGKKLADGIPQDRAAAPTEGWKVLKIADGDTITVQRGNVKEKIRFCGIDAVEKQQELGTQATDYLRSLIAKGDGTVMVSPIEEDRYGRTVAELFVKPQPGTPGYQPEEEIFLNGEMVRAGLSYHYAKYSERCPNRDAIIKAEAIARSQHVGVWRDQYSIPPWEFRKQQRQNRGN